MHTLVKNQAMISLIFDKSNSFNPQLCVELLNHFKVVMLTKTIVVDYPSFQAWKAQLKPFKLAVFSDNLQTELTPNSKLTVFNNYQQLLVDNNDLIIFATPTLVQLFDNEIDQLIVINPTSKSKDQFNCNWNDFVLIKQTNFKNHQVGYFDKKSSYEPPFTVVTDHFFGNLTDLFSLLVDKKVSVNDVDIGLISLQYLNIIANYTNKKAIEKITDYLVITSKILAKKADNLLNDHQEESVLEYDLATNNFRDKMIANLVEHKRYCDSLGEFEKLRINRLAYFSKANEMEQFIKTANDQLVTVEDQLPNYISVLKLFHAMNKLLEMRLSSLLTNKNITIKELSVEQVQKELVLAIKQFNYQTVSLKRVLLKLNHPISLMYFVTAFVALLVLLNNQVIGLEQKDYHSELYIFLLDENQLKTFQESPDEMVKRIQAQQQQNELIIAKNKQLRAIKNKQKRADYLKKKYGENYLDKTNLKDENNN